MCGVGKMGYRSWNLGMKRINTWRQKVEPCLNTSAHYLTNNNLHVHVTIQRKKLKKQNNNDQLFKFAGIVYVNVEAILTITTKQYTFL